MKLWSPGEAMAAIGMIIVFAIIGAIQGHLEGGLIVGAIGGVGSYATMMILNSRKHTPSSS